MSDGTHQLPEASRNALIHLADRMREGFTGRIEIECQDGGVRWVSVKETMKPDDLAKSLALPRAS